MDLFTSKQQNIDRRAAEVMAAYPALWSQMITEWHQPGLEDRAWLMYSAGFLDGLFAHLWLGRDCALMANPPLLNAFCRFCEGLTPKRVILTHLDEFARDADNFWDSGHVQRFQRGLKTMLQTFFLILLAWESALLFVSILL